MTNSPALDVILQNIPPFSFDMQLCTFLDSLGIAYEHFTLIKNRGFGFMRFSSIEYAQEFVERFKNGLDFNGTQLRIDFARDESSIDGWTCQVRDQLSISS